MDLLYRFEGSLDEPVVLGPVVAGLRIDWTFSGRVTAGALAGARAWGTDYQLLRRDGIAVFDARDTFEVPGGHVQAAANGYVLAPDGVEMPAVEEMLDPAFQPADVRFLIHGYGTCETGVPDHEQLNRALVKVDGWVNMGTGELVFEGRAVAADAAVALGAGVAAAA
jgi:hypothetical protein